jgi:hypothetical protein
VIIFRNTLSASSKQFYANQLDGRLHCFYRSDGSILFATYAMRKDVFLEVILWPSEWEYAEMKKRTRYGVEFVNLRVPAEDKAKVTQWMLDHEVELGDMLDDLVSSGYKISLNLDSGNDCHLVAITGSDDAVYNRGLCMTSRAGSPVEALYVGLYKHYVLCDGKDWPIPELGDQTYG